MYRLAGGQRSRFVGGSSLDCVSALQAGAPQFVCPGGSFGPTDDE
jgi:hypothetical protein